MESYEVYGLAYDAVHDVLYAACVSETVGKGVWSYTGGTWTNVGTDDLGLVVYQLAVDATRGVLYAGTDGQGVWSAGLPSIESVSPGSGRRGTTMDVRITGRNTHFTAGESRATFSGDGIKVNSTTVTDGTHATANITISPSAAMGKRSVGVVTGREVPYVLTGGFDVNQGRPEVTGITPPRGKPGDVVTVTGSGFGSSRFAGAGVNGGPGSTVSFGGVPAVEYISWKDDRITCLVPESARTGPVVVTTAPGESGAGGVFTVVRPDWYLAEGSTAWGFSCYLSIVNPNRSTVNCDITYQTPGGPVPGGTVTLPAESQATVNPRDRLGNTDFSTRVSCAEGEAIAVDRTMSWTGTGAAQEEAHSSIGVSCPSRDWYLPEGSSSWGFECWLMI